MFWKKTNSPAKEIAVKLYATCVDRVKNPVIYQDYSINDEVLGRFEVLSLFLFMMLRRLKKDTSTQSAEISQELVDLFVEDMDHSLRNARLSEKGIDKNFKRFVEGFFGRLVAYDTALDNNSLEQAIYRNVYDGNNEYNDASKKLGAYIKEQLNVLNSQNDIQLLCFN
ncbi:MAG: hypothetical protein KF820_06940 [Candidatus Paracaedibacteraceae bacterium]|nr:hypothetical protein [Candidatus Paracaedibacteraceae bacterium]